MKRLTTDDLWSSLVEVCASTTSKDHAEVKQLVQVSRADIAKALARIEKQQAKRAAVQEENERLRAALSKQNEEISQTLGKALGYPWFKDDQKNFPDATEEHGVCVGDHVAETLAMEAARRISALREALRPFIMANRVARNCHLEEYDLFPDDCDPIPSHAAAEITCGHLRIAADLATSHREAANNDKRIRG